MKNSYLRQSTYKLILDLFTEGEKTEFQYVKNFIEYQFKRDKIRPLLQLADSDAINLVSKAEEHMKNIKTTKGEVPRQVWIIFDHDNHDEKVTVALKKAASYNRIHPERPIHIAFMKPCIELWGIMHFKNKNLPIINTIAQKQLHELMPSYHHQRNPIFDINKLTETGYQQAVNLAKSWEVSLDDKNNPNSSSHYAGIYKLTEEIKKTF